MIQKGYDAIISQPAILSFFLRTVSYRVSLLAEAFIPCIRRAVNTRKRGLHKQRKGSLSNHDNDGNKRPTNLHIWQWKTAFFSFWHFEDVFVLSTTWNDLFCRCVDDVSVWWQMFNFVFLCPKRWFQFNSRIVRTHFSSIMSVNNWKMIAETRSHIFRWRSRFRRRRVCLSSLKIGLLLEWILQNMVRHFVTHKQVQADKWHPI